MWTFSCINFLLFVCYVTGIILHTKQGSLKGETLKSRDGRTFYAFYNIPYAEPPVGELRFRDPVPPKKWDGVRDATVLPPACIYKQMKQKINGQEDCLYLNVYTPKISNDTLLPVMVFIYGGRFMYEHALPSRYGPHYFMDEDVVLITFHYRLGALGFLSTEDEVIPGNYGLKDTIAVLKWVQEYINSFGGDKNKVTVLGGSSGGATATLISISPLAQGLFHRVICQSGFPSVASRGAASRDAWKFASLVGCNDFTITSSQALLNCLKKIPAEVLVENQLKAFDLSIFLPTTLWFPVIETEKAPGAFLVDEPRKLFNRETDVPLIMGINEDEGAMTAILMLYNSVFDVRDVLDRDYQKLFPLLLEYTNRVNNSEYLNKVTEILKENYIGDVKISENARGLGKMIKDLFFGVGIKYFSKIYKGPSYLYYYSHKNQQTFAHLYGEFEEDMGIIHGDELVSFFNWSEAITPVTEGIDYTVSKQLVKLWTNFADKGDPNGDDDQLWKPMNPQDFSYLLIKNGTFQTENGFMKSETEYLESIGIDCEF